LGRREAFTILQEHLQPQKFVVGFECGMVYSVESLRLDVGTIMHFNGYVCYHTSVIAIMKCYGLFTVLER
jgi:hypothetical protein